MFSFNFLSHSCQLLALVVIIGGTLSLGALAAPCLFRTLAREEAGAVMVDIFTHFEKWIKVSSVILFFGKLLELIYLKPLIDTREIMSIVLVLAISFVSFYLVFVLSPKLNLAYQNDTDEFGKLHNKSESLHRVNFLLGLLLLFFFAS